MTLLSLLWCPVLGLHPFLKKIYLNVEPEPLNQGCSHCPLPHRNSTEVFLLLKKAFQGCVGLSDCKQCFA